MRSTSMPGKSSGAVIGVGVVSGTVAHYFGLWLEVRSNDYCYLSVHHLIGSAFGTAIVSAILEQCFSFRNVQIAVMAGDCV